MHAGGHGRTAGWNRRSAGYAANGGGTRGSRETCVRPPCMDAIGFKILSGRPFKGTSSTAVSQRSTRGLKATLSRAELFSEHRHWIKPLSPGLIGRVAYPINLWQQE